MCGLRDQIKRKPHYLFSFIIFERIKIDMRNYTLLLKGKRTLFYILTHHSENYQFVQC